MTEIAHPDRNLLALGVRQPWAELILRGVKTVEVRSLPTNVRGTIYVYASRKTAETPPALAAIDRYELDPAALPLGLLVGTVEIVDCRPCDADDAAAACVPAAMLRGRFGWRLANPKRLPSLLKPRFLPYGIWFYPFRRRNGAVR